MSEIIEGTVTALSSDGRGILKCNDQAVFIEGVFPGDHIRIEVSPNGRVVSGRLLELITPSPHRVLHRCGDSCPSAPWGGLLYEEQLRQKTELTKRALRKTFRECEVLEIIPSPKSWEYRSRVTLNVWPERNRLAAGYMATARMERGIEISDCALAVPFVREGIRQVGNALSHVGSSYEKFPKRIQIHDTENGAGLLLIYAGNVPASVLEFWSDAFDDSAPGGMWQVAGNLAGVIVPHSRVSSNLHSRLMRTSWLGHVIKVHPLSFCQVNRFCEELVHRRLQELYGKSQIRKVWDIYGGYGALGFAAAPEDSELTVIESSAESKETFDQLSGIRKLRSQSFIAKDADGGFREIAGDVRKEDLIILDPPRSGASSELLTTIGLSKGAEIAYLSCDPAKLGRDMANLSKFGFAPREIQPYDFFPQTTGIEVLAILLREPK